MKYLILALVLAPSSLALSVARVDSPGPAPGPALGPALGPAPAPAPESSEPSDWGSLPPGPGPSENTQRGLAFTFELGNVNYDDLEKEVPSPPPPQASQRFTEPVSTGATVGPGGNTWDGMRQVGQGVSDAHYAISKAAKDTVDIVAGHVNDKVQDGSEAVTGATADTAEAIHRGVKNTGDTVHGAATGTADAIHTGIHGEEPSTKRHKLFKTQVEFMSLAARTKMQVLVASVMENAIRTTFQNAVQADTAPAPAPAPGLAGPAPSPAAPAGLKAPSSAPSPALAAPVIGSAPAPGPAPAGMLAGAPGPAPVGSKKVNVFVDFQPGQPKNIAVVSADETNGALPPADHEAPDFEKEILRHSNPLLPGKKEGRTTKVEVVITDQAGTGVDGLPHVKEVIQRKEDDGSLEDELGKSLQEVIGITPTFSNFAWGVKQIKQWSVEKCETQMAEIIKRFSMAYTPRMVPMALFNECTNYMTAMSFSHDALPTPLDVAKCKEATVTFAKQWNYGQGSGLAPPPAGLALASKATHSAEKHGKHYHHHATAADMNGFCVDVCERKFGLQAPQCHVTEGEKNKLRGH